MSIMFLLLLTLLNVVGQIKSNAFKGPPENVTLTWQSDEITVQATKAQYTKHISDFCFQMVLQLKSSNAMEWQKPTTNTDCYTSEALMHCYFYNINLDPEKCIQIQLKYQIKDVCTYSTKESEWSQTIFTKNGSVLDSCAEDETKLTPMGDERDSFLLRPFFIIIFSTISCLVLIITLSLGCAMERVKKCIFPAIPDPKNVFSELFDSHSGYFQEWIKTSGDEIQQEEVDWTMDEQHEEQMSIYMKDNESLIPDIQQAIAEEAENVTASAPVVENVSDACFGNMNFVTNESMYIIL